MKSFVADCFNLIKNNLILFWVLVGVFVFGVVLGLLTPVFSIFSKYFSDFGLIYFKAVLSPDSSAFSFLVKRLIYSLCFIGALYLLSLNKVLYYACFALMFLRAYFLGLSARIIISALGVFGVFSYLFLVFLQGVFVYVGASLYLLSTYKKQCEKCYAEKFFKKAILAFIISAVGAIIEFLLLVFLFRPLSFYY
ncbi:MAG: hypothetical protein IKL82_04380 [Clostridia bacterium]|nr:hypothetical protein [Clostridia bacterium]